METKPTNPADDGDWLLTRARSVDSRPGPFLFRNFQRQPPTPISRILAMNAAICKDYPRCRTWHSRARLVFNGSRRTLWSIVGAMRQHAKTAKRTFGRSYFAQARDMFTAWWISDLPPGEYYEALMARHHGGPEVTNYVASHIVFRVVATLQLDVFDEPSFSMNDKAAFGAWVRRNKLPGPAGFAVVTGQSDVTPHDLHQLGNKIIIKPCKSGEGEGVEAWDLDEDDQWHSGSNSLAATELLSHITQRAGAEYGGVIVQDRLMNHPEIAHMCNQALSTCRFVTIRNETGDPEIVEYFWRMGSTGSIVDNYIAGGFFWIARDMGTGEFVHGIETDTARKQQTLTHHPLTGTNMAGLQHPFWNEASALALKAHTLLGDVVFAGWDIASTPNGVVLIEVNIPCTSPPRTQMLTGGTGSSRYGELLAFHADRWLEARRQPK